jgi:hypothetical protein
MDPTRSFRLADQVHSSDTLRSIESRALIVEFDEGHPVASISRPAHRIRRISQSIPVKRAVAAQEPSNHISATQRHGDSDSSEVAAVF